MNINGISNRIYNRNTVFGMNIDASDDFKMFSDIYIKGGYKGVVKSLKQINDTENDTVEFSILFSKPRGFYYKFNDRNPVYLYAVPNDLSKIPHNSLIFPINIIKNSFTDSFEKNLKRI